MSLERLARSETLLRERRSGDPFHSPPNYLRRPPTPSAPLFFWGPYFKSRSSLHPFSSNNRPLSATPFLPKIPSQLPCPYHLAVGKALKCNPVLWNESRGRREEVGSGVEGREALAGIGDLRKAAQVRRDPRAHNASRIDLLPSPATQLSTRASRLSTFSSSSRILIPATAVPRLPSSFLPAECALYESRRRLGTGSKGETEIERKAVV